MLELELRQHVCRVACVLLLSVAAVPPASAQTSSLPAPWIDQDVGSPLIAGDASIANGVMTVDASGADIWGSSDQFHFVYQKVHGDVDVRARVDSLSYSSSWSKAGVMIRSALTATSANAYALVSYSRGTLAQRRAQSAALTTAAAGPAMAAPGWVRLTRVGDTVTSYVSSDGQTWVTVAEDTVPLGADTYVGIAVTSHNAFGSTTARVSNVAVTALGLPAGQQHADIGSPALAGKAIQSSGIYQVYAGGTDIWGSADQFHYVYQPLSGDADVVLRVASIGYADVWSKVGVMIRESLAANARHATAFVSAGKGYAFQRRPDIGGVSVNTAGGSGTAPGWLRLKRVGSTFTAYRSADGQNWTIIGSDSIPMGSNAYAGIAVTSHNATTATTILADSFKVTQAAAPANQPPAVSLTAPANGATYTAPASIALTASASDPENQLARVEFYAGATLLATDAAAPFAFTWSLVPAGSYTLTVRAYDTAGAVTTSAPVTVTVGTATTTTAPTGIAFLQSANPALVTSYRLDVFASAADPATATPVSSLDLGKPAPDATGTITVSIPAFFTALKAGTYQATVAAVGAGGTSRSAPVVFTR